MCSHLAYAHHHIKAEWRIFASVNWVTIPSGHGLSLCGDNPWLEWMMAYCQLDPPKWALMETKSKCEYFHSWKCCIKTWRLQNAGDFIPTFHSHETAISIYPGNLLLHAVAIKSPVGWDVPKVERSEIVIKISSVLKVPRKFHHANYETDGIRKIMHKPVSKHICVTIRGNTHCSI